MKYKHWLHAHPPDKYELSPQAQKSRQGPQGLQQVSVMTAWFSKARAQLSIA